MSVRQRVPERVAEHGRSLDVTPAAREGRIAPLGTVAPSARDHGLPVWMRITRLQLTGKHTDAVAGQGGRKKGNDNR